MALFPVPGRMIGTAIAALGIAFAFAAAAGPAGEAQVGGAAPAAAGQGAPGSPSGPDARRGLAAPEGEEMTDEEKKLEAQAFENFEIFFGELNENVKTNFGDVPPFRKMERAGRRAIKITPNAVWMANPRGHFKNSMLLYNMWRNANRFFPVTLIITDENGGDYIIIKDTPQGLEYRTKPSPR